MEVYLHRQGHESNSSGYEQIRILVFCKLIYTEYVDFNI